MKKFMFQHFGFKKPTPEIMKAWEAWAESLDAAEKLAQSNPFIASIRIYELRSM